MKTLGLYVDSNSIRKVVLTLCEISRQVFEISLNSSLITDELASKNADQQSYAIYSEKLSLISLTLENISRGLLKDASAMMETSLESTKLQERHLKISQGLALVKDESNRLVTQAAIKTIEDRLVPVHDAVLGYQQKIAKGRTSFGHAVQKLWLLHTNLKVEAEKSEIAILMTIITRTEDLITRIDPLTRDLDAGMDSLSTQLSAQEK